MPSNAGSCEKRFPGASNNAGMPQALSMANIRSRISVSLSRLQLVRGRPTSRQLVHVVDIHPVVGASFGQNGVSVHTCSHDELRWFGVGAFTTSFIPNDREYDPVP